MREKALKLLGLMRRANAIQPGEDRAGEAVQAGKARLLLLASDAAVSRRSWEQMEPPGYAASYKLQTKTLRWLAETAGDPECAGVLCSHDPDASEGCMII